MGLNCTKPSYKNMKGIDLINVKLVNLENYLKYSFKLIINT